MGSQRIATDQRPIGFWLKLVDRLIDANLASTLHKEQLTRRMWQVLNAVKLGGTTAADIDDALQPFLSDTEATTVPSIDQLCEIGWLRAEGDGYAFTDRGTVSFERVDALITTSRRTLMAGIDPRELQSTISVLERMARNLDWEASPV
jgi:hypothetical protein